MDLSYIGPFTISSDAIIIADTGCNYETEIAEHHAGEIYNPMPGEWGAYVDYSGSNVIEIIAISSDNDINNLHEKKWKEMSFTLKSLSGQICIFDKSKFQNDNDIVDILINHGDVLIGMTPSTIKGEMWHMACIQMTNVSNIACISNGVIYCPDDTSEFCKGIYKCFGYYQNDICIGVKIKLMDKIAFYQSSDEESTKCLSSDDSTSCLSSVDSSSIDFSSESDDTYFEMTEDD